MSIMSYFWILFFLSLLFDSAIAYKVYSMDNQTKSSLIYEGALKLHANQFFKAKLIVKLATGLSPKGRVVIATRHVSDFGDPQMQDPSAENYITVNCSNKETKWQLREANDWKRHPWNRGIDLELVVDMPNDGKWHVITVASDDGRFFARSNPVGPKSFGWI